MAKACSKNPVARMDKRVDIEAVTQTSDGQGGYMDGWAVIGTVWAEITPVKGYEKMQAMQMNSPITHKVNMRYYAGLTTKHRITYLGRVFEIKEVLNVDEQNTFHKLTCVET